MNDIHDILFNAYIMYTTVVGIWATMLVARNQRISGSFWGTMAINTILAGVILLIGVVMFLQGLRPERALSYFLYMSWLTVSMPGIYGMLRGRDDQKTAILFAVLAFFNAGTAFSIVQRAIATPWT